MGPALKVGNPLLICVDLSPDSVEVGPKHIHVVKLANLASFVVHDVLLLLFDVVDRSLNLGCQILLQDAQIVLLLLVMDPVHGLVLFFKDVDLLSGELRLGTTAKEERKVLWINLASSLVSKHASRD